ncbi:MAG: DUF6568 family protein [Bacilli bacterium]
MANKKSKDINKKIPVKNYIILGTIIIITLLVSMYLFSWYRQYADNRISKPIITETLREVEYNNLNTVLKERDVLIMYMCTTDEDICRSFEKKFASFVKDNNLTEEIVYLNLGYSSDESGLLDKVYSKYKSDDLVKKVYSYPTLLIFNQGKIVDVLSSSGKNKISINQVEDFLESYEL